MMDSLSQSDRAFLEELQQLGSGTISQLCEKQGVTTTAIRQRLVRLQAAGFISRETIRAHRGRPQHEYRLTNEGKRLLGDNYSELATILWAQLRGIQNETLRVQLLGQVRDALIKKYGSEVQGESPAERLDELQGVLQDHGFHVEIDADSEHLVLQEHNCPYHDLAVGDRSICDLEQQVFGQIVGVPLQLTQRCVEGHSCCRFEEVSSGTEKSGQS